MSVRKLGLHSGMIVCLLVVLSLVSQAAGQSSGNSSIILEPGNGTVTAPSNCSDEALAAEAQRCVPKELADMVSGRRITTDVTNVCRLTEETQECLDNKTQSCGLTQDEMKKKRNDLLPFVDPMISVCRVLGSSDECTAENLENCLMVLPADVDAAKEVKDMQLCTKLKFTDMCLSHYKCADVDSFKTAMFGAVDLWNSHNKVESEDSFFYCNDSVPDSHLLPDASSVDVDVEFYCTSARDPDLACSISLLGLNATSSWEPCQNWCDLAPEIASCVDDGKFYNFTTSSCQGCTDLYVSYDGYVCVDNSSGASSVQVTSLLLMTSLMWAMLWALF